MYGFTITGKGRTLLASLLAGNQLVLTRIMVGKGKIDEDTDPRSLAGLIEPVALATSTVPVQQDETVSFIVEYRNDMNGGLTEGFWLSEFGIFAKDQDDEEILLYYASLGEYPQYVTALASGSIDVRRYPVVINVSADAEVVLAYPAAAFMTAEEIDDYINHKVLPYFLEKAEEIVGDRASREDLENHVNNQVVHVTAEERVNWNAAYDISQDTQAIDNITDTLSGIDEKLGELDDSLAEDQDAPVSISGGLNELMQYMKTNLMETFTARMEEAIITLETKTTEIISASRQVVFDTPGAYEWTVPKGVYQIFVTACGGGGGGSCNTANTGGGGAAAVVDKEYTVTPGETIRITIGAGGAGAAATNGARGETGQPTTIGSMVTLAGGGGDGSSGGSGGGWNGMPGIIGVAGGDVKGGGNSLSGGGGSLGHGGYYRRDSSNTDNSYTNVVVYRGAGGGGGDGSSSAGFVNSQGCKGGDGYCKITW